MPNYRQKNRKKNNKKNKQNKNNQNQNQNSNKQQQQQGGEEKESPTTTTKTKQNQKQQVAQEQGQKTTKLQHDAHAGNVSNEPTVDNSNKDHVDHIENLRDDDVVPLTSTSNENAAETKVDTVSKENATQKELLVDIDTNNVQTNNMGTKQSKEPQSTNNSIAIEEEEEDQQHAQLCVNENEVKNQQVKVIIHRIVPEIVDEQSVGERQAQVITHAIAIEEEPEEDDQLENESDNADITTYQVQSPSSNDESFEAANDASHKHTLEIQEIFNEEDEISNAQESETTLSSAAKADDYKLKRAQKRVALETHFLPQLLSPRYLDSILEENSDLSDCSDRPGLLRSLSASSGETEYLQELRSRRANAKFPRSNLDFSKTHKHGDLPNTLPTLPGPISEEPLAMMVEAKLIEQFPDQPQESCTKLTFKHLEESTDTAEVIFINSSTSSSTSDLLELDEQEVEREPINLDTDAHDIINKPADENDLTTCTTERETTPVNNAISTDISSLIASKLETAEVETMNETTNKQAILIGNEEYDHLNNDEQYSQCSTETETIVDVSQASSSGHETSTSEAQPQQKVANNIKSFDDSSVLSTTSISNSSIVDASSVEDSSSSSAEALARLEETCREIMDNVREIVYANANHNNNNNINVNDDVDNLTITTKPQYNGLSYGLPPQNVTYTPYNTNGKQKSPTPPPIPPPPQLDSYTTCNESAYINTNNIHVPPSVANQLPPCSSSKNNGVLERQESADSHCSSSTNQSQCTAINIAQRDIDVSSPIFSDNLAKTTTSTHNSDLMKLKQKNSETIQKLRQLCTQKLATLPYGEQVLVELANLAQNIGKMPMRGEEEIQSNLRELHEMIIGRDEKVQKQVQFAEQKTPSNEIVHKIVYENVRCEEEADNTMNEALRKRLTPSPPPLPPPPVPMKSSETVAKAQQHEQQQNSRIIPIVFEQKNDASKEQKTTFTKAYEDDSIEKQQQQQQEQQIKQKAEQFANETTTKTSSVENNSRQTENSYATGKEFKEEKHFSSSSSSETKSSASFSNNFPLKTPRPLGDMPGVESEIGRMFPNLGSANIFDDNQKRFSNIEGNTRSMFPGNTPKRYSNIETSSYEAQKRIENGQVVYDYENKQHETVKDGDEVDASMLKNANKIQHDIQTHDTQKVPENMRSTFNLNEHLQTTKNTANTSTSKPSIDDEKKLFKDFDELSQQLHHELETGRQQREEREKSASLFDLSRTHMKQQLEELKKQRQAHLNELEREIQRSMKSRESRREQLSEQQQQHNVHEIPIKLEGLSAGSKTKENEFQHDVNSAFRRSESLFNLNNTNQQPDVYVRPRTASSNYEVQQQQLLSDDWSQYTSDVGSSENISRPFARETQVCYQRMSPRPREIRAPRLTVSSHDLSSTPTFDPLNAYNVPRTKRTPSTSLYSLYEGDSEQRQQSTQCYSVLQRDPNPTYIGTTSRRGVSPAPQQPTNRPQPAPRRASLPREIHEQQLKYITSKEEELRLEFERLQNERRRLLEELQNEQTKEQAQPVVQPQVPPRTKLNYRAAPRLPTLSEDEVLRQQMAEEWLNKVAEREERRSQKTIKISKIQEEQLGAKQYMEDMHSYSSLKPDLSQEFLERVKERRHKLHMPADSDWESGAESQPNKAKTQEASVPEIKVISGKSVADVQNLPQHLKEFAHYTNQETEQLENGGKRSVFEEEERRQEATPYSSSSATKKSTVATTYKVSRVPPQTLAPGQGRPYKSNGYQSEPEPNYDSDQSTIKYRTLDRRRLQSCSSNVNVRNNTNSYPDDSCYGTLPNPVKSSHSAYKNQPGRIEDYVTGRSSISEKEKKEWWDEVMDIFNGSLDQAKLSPRYAEGNLSRALAKDSGYTSDSNLVFRKKVIPQASGLSPVEQKQAYKSVQAGGEPPLFGFRKPAPEKPKGYMEKIEYYQITPTLTKIRISCQEIPDKSECKPKPTSADKSTLTDTDTSVVENPQSEMFNPFHKNIPSFMPLGAKKDTKPANPPAPPCRKSSCTKSTLKKDTGKENSNTLQRHERCFKTATEDKQKFGTITLKSQKKERICRSKSAGAVSTALASLLSNCTSTKNSTTPLKVCRLTGARSPTRRRIMSLRQSSLSPVAFGRSISKERSFAEEKKRLENTLPLSRTTFEASTNILRDPSLKSPQEVKQAVRSYATCPARMRSKSLPRIKELTYNPHVTINTTTRHTVCYPQVPETRTYDSNGKIVKKSNTSARVGNVQTSTNSLARTSSTFSVESKEKSNKLLAKKSTGTLGKSLQNSKSENNIYKKRCSQIAEKPQAKTKKDTKPSTEKIIQKTQYLKETIVPIAIETKSLVHEAPMRNISPARSELLQDQMKTCYADDDFYSEFEDPSHIDELLWHYEARSQPSDLNTNNIVGTQEDRKRKFSPTREVRVPPEEARPSTPHTGWQPSRPDSPVRQFSPTREVRVPQTPRSRSPVQPLYDSRDLSVTKSNEQVFLPTKEVRVPPPARNVRSPSRRKIESCRTQNKGEQTKKVIRASSLSSADDRLSGAGLYRCSEFAHSATSLSSHERHSPICRYQLQSERFTDLNRFYNTLERVGQLERATSISSFKPIRKESELVDFDEWRQVRLHERAEKELNYLVNKLKQEQREKDLLFRAKDVEDIKWRREKEFALHIREKSVEDLREDFEKKQLLNFDHCAYDVDRKCIRPYYRRNTVADLASNLEEKLHHESRNEQLTSSLSTNDRYKIIKQLNDLYGKSEHVTVNEDYVVTVDADAARKAMAKSKLKVRSNSSITRDELLGSVLRKKQACAKDQVDFKPKRSTSPVHLARETRGATAAKNADVKHTKPPEVPPLPDTQTTSKELQPYKENKEKISQKIHYFESRKFDEPPKTIYHAREDSSPDESEVMELIEQNIKKRTKAEQKTREKDISTSLTDLKNLFGEREQARVSFYRSIECHTPEQAQIEHKELVETHLSPAGSFELYDTYYRSRSPSPNSDSSSYLSRVHTGEVEKIKQKFESLKDQSQESDFFGFGTLRKVRSDPEFNALDSGSKDALDEQAGAVAVTVVGGSLKRCAKKEEKRGRSRNRKTISPIPLKSRFMPHIDNISKRAALKEEKQIMDRKSKSTSENAQHDGLVERMRTHYEKTRYVSLSNPDISEDSQLAQHLSGDWIAHKYPKPSQNNGVCKKVDVVKKSNESRVRSHSMSPTRPIKCKHHQQESTIYSTIRKPRHGDIFANQKFDASKHQPKARYVPDGAETSDWNHSLPPSLSIVGARSITYQGF